MPILPRLISRPALVLAAALALGPVGGTHAAITTDNPGAIASFLAGQQALEDLNTTRAADLLVRAARADWDNPIIVERAFVALAADGRIAESAEMARHLLDLDGTYELASIVAAAEDLMQGRYSAAETGLSRLGTDTFPGLTGSILRAWALVGESRLDDAEDLLSEVGDEGLQQFLVFHRALMADVAGDTNLAIELAAAAHETDPLVARLVEAYARMLGGAGRYDEALEVLDGFEAQGASHPLVDAVRPAIEERRDPGMFARNAQAGAAEMFHSMGAALSRESSPDLAVVFLQIGHYLDPESHAISMALGELFGIHGQHETAIDVYDRIPEGSPMKPLAVVRVAENLDAMGERPEAISRLTAIVEAHPEDLDAVSVLGDIYRNDRRYSEAADAYTQALDITGGDSRADWRFYYVRGIAYERNKEWPKAESDFQRALELNPNQPQVLNYLGYSWVDQGMHLDDALGMIETAVAAAPNDGYIIDSLGWAFYRLGRFDEAVQVLEQAVQLLPNDPEINDHLGDAYWRVGRKMEARFQWNVAAYVDEEGEVRERVAPKLQGGLDAAPVPEDAQPIVETPAPSR